jgi:hypothetical protein
MDGWLLLVKAGRKNLSSEMKGTAAHCAWRALCSGNSLPGVSHFTPKYPTEIYTNITEKLRKDIKSLLDRLEI